jgi:hypothetical protein
MPEERAGAGGSALGSGDVRPRLTSAELVAGGEAEDR